MQLAAAVSVTDALIIVFVITQRLRRFTTSCKPHQRPSNINFKRATDVPDCLQTDLFHSQVIAMIAVHGNTSQELQELRQNVVKYRPKLYCTCRQNSKKRQVRVRVLNCFACDSYVLRCILYFTIFRRNSCNSCDSSIFIHPMIVGTEVTRYVAFTITPICLKLSVRILEPLLLFIDDY